MAAFSYYNQQLTSNRHIKLKDFSVSSIVLRQIIKMFREVTAEK